uniref:Uncharacterized protein n=1 Tax=Candidatus Kentrum sp. TUN TaxID=2126343 RepID=A0A451ACY0_9GAMM|nr:MAG: hypothetical protein BECKTUN1418D_GA0071000_12307 [Candidatus Kentron sp. TUN]
MINSKQGKRTREMTPVEWEHKGEQLFGKDRKKWKFVCPKCGKVQSPKEFLAHKEKGAKPDDAYLKCVTRFEGADSNQGRCLYSTDGVDVGAQTRNPPIILKLNGNRRIRVFDFAGEC